MLHYLKKPAAAALVAATAALSFAAQAQEFSWDIAEEHGAQSLPGKMNARFAEILAEKSGGRIKVTPHYGGAMGFKAPEHLDMVASGAVQFASTPLHTHGGTDPFLELGTLPFIAENPEHAKILFDMALPRYNEILAKHNQIVIAVSPWTPTGWWSSKPIEKAEDLNGWSVRTIDLNAQLALKELGANPISLPWGDLIPALSTNTVQGVMTAAGPGADADLPQYLKYYTEINYGWPWHTLHMNLDVFNSLPQDLQQLVLDTGKQLTEEGFARIGPFQDESLQRLRDAGVTIIEGSPELIEAVKKAGQGPIDSWLERVGEDGRKFYEEYKAKISG
jgi:TRAP-type C4-dicarboxylate transport system substrate-binding protein